METLLETIIEQAPYAHWILFFLIMLAGLNVPISEDVILITGGAIAATCDSCSPYLFVWLLIACWTSAWEAYWIGRLLGPKLYHLPWFHRFINPERVQKLHYYYEKFGIFTFIVGRFIPGGVRNGLFMSAGLGKMPFLTFILRDSVACLLSASALFSLGYGFGENHRVITAFVQKYQTLFGIGLFLSLLVGFLTIYAKKSFTAQTEEQ